MKRRRNTGSNALRRKITRAIKNKPWKQATLARTRLIAEHALEGKGFYKRLPKEKKAVLRKLVLSYYGALVQQVFAAEELWQKFRSGKIDKKAYFRRMSQTAPAFKEHMILEEIQEFCAENNISYERDFDKLLVEIVLVGRQMPSSPD